MLVGPQYGKRHTSGNWNFKVTPTLLENLYTADLKA
jgi:hypothetical protein